MTKRPPPEAMNDDQAKATPEPAVVPDAATTAPPEFQVAPEPPISLTAYAAERQLKPWLLAALRTKCPIEQHMRHGHTKANDGAAQAEYVAHTDGHAKTAAEWDELAHEITNLPMGVR